MPYTVAALARNVVSGARLALFLPVERLRFRIDPLQLLLVVLVSALVDVGADWLRYGPEAEFSLAAVGSELAATALLLLGGAFLAWWSREQETLLALPVIVLASFVPLQLAGVALDVVPDGSVPGGERGVRMLHLALVAWIVIVLARAAWVAQASRPARSMRAMVTAAVLALPLFLPAGILPSDPWWEEGDGAQDGATNAASEPVLALQRELQDDALAGLEDHAPGATDLYFVGFAADGAGPTWQERMETAKRVLEGHWAASGRTLAYVNDPDTVTEAPMATVTHLREALQEIAAASDPDEDVLMLYVAGRANRDGSLRVSVPPLDLVQLSGPGLRSLLDEAGIRWRIVVLSVCAPGPFVEALADENTVVIANAEGGTELAECARGGEPVAFGDAFFNDAMPRSSSITGAFERARAQLAQSGSGVAKPFLHVGQAIAAKLDSVRGRSGGTMARTAPGVRLGG